MVSPLPNPPFPNQCGLNVVVVIDESGSIDNTEILQVRQAVTRFVDALTGTPSKISLVIFNIQARVLLPLTSVLDAEGAKTVKAALNFPREGRGTNWEAAFDTARGLGGDLIVFATDGNPGGSSVILNPLQNGIAAANRVKSDGTRIVAIGIGDGLNIENLKAISGPTENDDYYLANFDSLSSQLRAIALRLCGASVTVVKKVEQPDGQYAPAAGWTFNIQLDPALAPTLVVTPADGVTRDDGTVNFKWTAPGETSVTLTEMPRDGFLLTDVSAIDNEGSPIAVTSIPNGVSLTVGPDDVASCEFRSAAVGNYALVFSRSPNRSAPIRPLAGAQVDGDIYPFIWPTTGIHRVSFSLGRSLNRSAQDDRTAPFDFRGGTSTTANPFDTRQLPNGEQAITTRLRLQDGTEQQITTPFVIHNARLGPSDYKLVFSKQPDRSGPVADLQGATVNGSIYAFLQPVVQIRRVRFWLDDRDRLGRHQQLENAPPYDYEGGSIKVANPFNTRPVANGSHTITTEVLMDDHTSFVFDTVFTVANEP